MILDRGASALADLLNHPLTLRDPETTADAIVVLGAPLRVDGSLTEPLAERVEVGVELWRRGLAPWLCLTGGGARRLGRSLELRSRRSQGSPGRVEADAMAVRALELGVDRSCLILEREARNTEENARNLVGPLEAGARVWLVTQPFHLRRAVRCFARAGFQPLAWHIDHSLQYHQPRRALRWIAREYLAWAKVAVGPVAAMVSGPRRRPE